MLAYDKIKFAKFDK